MTYLAIALGTALLAMAALLLRMAWLASNVAKLIGRLEKSADLRNTGEVLRNELLSLQLRTLRLVHAAMDTTTRDPKAN